MSIPILASLLLACTAHGQTQPETSPPLPTPVVEGPPADVAPAEPANAAEEKRDGIDKAAAVAQCARAPYRKCLKLDTGACEAATATAVDKANAEIDALAAKRTPEQIETAFFKGMVIGVYIRHMEVETGGRFFACMQTPG
jgi:hypothetical protein